MFSFQMRVPLLIDLPEAAIYLRQQVEEVQETDTLSTDPVNIP